MDEYISREAVFQVVHGIARGIATKDIESFIAKDMKTFYKIKGAKEILDSVDTDLCYIPAADVQPVKHGRWLPSDSYITTAYGTIHCQICSECGADLMEDNDYDYDFCPVCGTRMDLKDGDKE